MNKSKLLFGVVLILYVFILQSVIQSVLNEKPPKFGEKELLGLGIGRFDSPSGIAYVSGQKLTCVPNTGTDWKIKCSILISDKQLDVFTNHEKGDISNTLIKDMICTAFYEEKEWPCKINSRHVHVSWFAYLEDPLDLDFEAMETLRAQNYYQNLSEGKYFQGMFLFSGLNAFFIIAFGILFLKRKNNSDAYLITIPIGLIMFFASFLYFISFVTRGLWD